MSVIVAVIKLAVVQNRGFAVGISIPTVIVLERYNYFRFSKPLRSGGARILEQVRPAAGPKVVW